LLLALLGAVQHLQFAAPHAVHASRGTCSVALQNKGPQRNQLLKRFGEVISIENPPARKPAFYS